MASVIGVFRLVVFLAPPAILGMFAAGSAAMIALTFLPGNETLWALNLAASSLFRHTFYLVFDSVGMPVTWSMIAFGGLALASMVTAGGRVILFRLTAAHVALGIVALPVVRLAVTASAGEGAFAQLATAGFTPALLSFETAPVILALAAFLACAACHMEVVRSNQRDRRTRDRARRLLGLA
jgi:hypothetical protein